MNKPLRTRLLPRLLLAVLAVVAAPLAQAWTDKPVRMLVPAPAGGTLGVVARILANQLSADIVDKINAATLKAATAPKVRDRLTAAGFEPNTALGSAQLGASVTTDYDRNAVIVKAFNIQLNQ